MASHTRRFCWELRTFLKTRFMSSLKIFGIDSMNLLTIFWKTIAIISPKRRRSSYVELIFPNVCLASFRVFACGYILLSVVLFSKFSWCGCILWLSSSPVSSFSFVFFFYLYDSFPFSLSHLPYHRFLYLFLPFLMNRTRRSEPSGRYFQYSSWKYAKASNR